MFFKKEAEMKVVKLAGVLGMMLAATAFGQHQISFGIVPEYSGDLMAVDPSVDAAINFKVTVAVSGPNQGLAAFLIGIGAYNAADFTYGHEVLTPAGPQLYGTGWVEEAYKAPGATAAGKVTDKAGSGGPGLDNGLGGYGYPASVAAWIEQAGQSYPLKWIGRTYATYTGGGTRKKWQGDLVWGIGMDSRKGVLLQDPEGDYPLFNGMLDVTGWAPGAYIVKIWPASSGNNVLRSEFNLNLNWEQNIVTGLTGPVDLTGGSFQFVIIPEPATLVLLAAAGALYRRRR